jgi:hypothetical protein
MSGAVKPTYQMKKCYEVGISLFSWTYIYTTYVCSGTFNSGLVPAYLSAIEIRL